jgi:hypothetical protein
MDLGTVASPARLERRPTVRKLKKRPSLTLCTDICFVLEPIALALNGDYRRVVEDAIERRRSQHRVAGEGLIRRSGFEVRITTLIALSHHLEEQIGARPQPR